jgi:hypothetical protein
MSFVFGNYESEVTTVLSKLSEMLNTPIATVDQLRSGLLISKLIALYLKRDKLDGILQGKTREIWQCNWEIILLHTQNLLPDEWKSIRAYELISDSGLLFTITKLFLSRVSRREKSISRHSSRPSQSHQGPRRYLSKSRSSVSIVLEDKPVPGAVSEEVKSQIHSWLVESQVIPPNLYLHEFMYRIRTGISLSDLINRLEGKSEVVHGVHKNPRNTSYCIANINKTLEYLRKIPKVNSKYLWSSAEIHAGSEEHVYGLLQDIRQYYMHRYPNYMTRARSSSTGRLRRNKSVEVIFTPIKVTSAMKRSVIQWVNSLGLERFVVFHGESKRDYIFNGVLLCEVVGEVFQNKVKYVFKPTSEAQCIENVNFALKIINSKITSRGKFPERVQEPNEEIIWAILWELMNNNRTYTDSYDTVGMKGLEESLVAWIDSMKLLPPRVTTILELVPGFRNGVLLAQIVMHVIPDKKLEIVPVPQTEHSATLNIRRTMALLRNEPRMSQKFTWKEREIHLGDLNIIFGLLEDLHKLADGIPAKSKSEIKPYLGPGFLSSTLKSASMAEIPPERNIGKVKELEEWVDGIGVRHSGLAGEHLKEFKSGEKLCEILEVLERNEFDGLHRNPKTTAAALANIRKALEHLYKKPAFPSKFMYLDDQILVGNGKVIRSLLVQIKKIYKNRLAW